MHRRAARYSWAAAGRAPIFALLAPLLPHTPALAGIVKVGFRNRYYRGHGYMGSRVLEHNQTGRFSSYVEATWTQAMAVDAAGRVWIADQNQHQIVFVDASTRYTGWPALYTDYAGMRGEAGYFDGNRMQARFSNPKGIAVTLAMDPLVIYVADTNNHCIRRLDYALGRTSTVAGNRRVAGLRDGPAVESRFNAPMSLGIDSTGLRLFILDNIRYIRYLDLSQATPVVRTLVGGACRAISREIAVATIIVRRVGCHPDWHDDPVEPMNRGVERFDPSIMCLGHKATCNRLEAPPTATAA